MPTSWAQAASTAECHAWQAVRLGHTSGEKAMLEMHGSKRTWLVALPYEAGAVPQAPVDVAVEAVVADVCLCALEPTVVYGAAAHVKVVGHVFVLPLQPLSLMR